MSGMAEVVLRNGLRVNWTFIGHPVVNRRLDRTQFLSLGFTW